MYVSGPPYCTYGLRIPASCVLYVPEAQGSLPCGLTHCTYVVRVPASGVPYVPRTVWCTPGGAQAAHLWLTLTLTLTLTRPAAGRRREHAAPHGGDLS